MEVDGVLDKLGRIGKFQILMYIFCGLQGISFPVWDILSVTSFMAPSAEYSCHPVSSKEEDREVVFMEYNSTVNGDCEDGELVFNLDTYGRTMITEWQLVRDKAMLVELSQSLFMVGMMVGSIVLGQMSDSFGRKPILIMCATLSPLLGLAAGFSPNIWVFTAIRILIGFICPGAILTAYVLALELFPSKRRAAASILLSSFNSVSYVSLAALAFFIKDWRYLQITTSAVRILLVPLCFFVPESIQWLAAKRKYDKLEKLLQKIATVNKIDIPFPILDIKKDQTDEPTVYKEPITSESDMPQKETDKSIECLYMYDSAVSLDRDYIPAEDNYSVDYYSSDSEIEEAFHIPSGNLSVSATSISNLPSRASQPQFPGHCERANVTGNMYRVSSSISILSELKEQNEILDSYESLNLLQVEKKIIPKPDEDLHLPKITVHRPLRKKSISLCNIPSIVRFESEIQGCTEIGVGNKLSSNINHRDLTKTVSIPNIMVNSTYDSATHDSATEIAKYHHRDGNKSELNRKPPNLIIISNEQAGSSFMLSVPTLALPFGFSQNMFPNIGEQYEYMETSQSEETIQDDTSGFNSSTSNMDYDSLEEGVNKKPERDGYSKLKTTCIYKKTKKETVKGYNVLDLFRTPSVRLITISSMILWFATYTVYVGLSMSTDALAGDPYINFSLIGLVEIPAVIMAAISAVRIGRRFPSGVFHFLTALSCCVYLVLPTDNVTTWSSMVSVVAILLAKCFTSAAYNVECLLTAEVLPTPLSTAFATVPALSIEVINKWSYLVQSTHQGGQMEKRCQNMISGLVVILGYIVS